MRHGVVWWSTALVLLAVATALRTQEGGTSRRRYHPAPGIEEKTIDVKKEANEEPTFRPRSRRPDTVVPRESRRLRTSSRHVKNDEVIPDIAQTQNESKTNERFHSRRTYSRTQPENDVTTAKVHSRTRVQNDSPTGKSNAIRSRSRQTVTTSTQPTIDTIQTQKLNENYGPSTTEFRRRSSITQATEPVVTRKLRGRISTRPNARSLDLDTVGTTNTFIMEKEPITSKSDFRSSRKLRYKPRTSETETNLPGEAISIKNEVTTSSQNPLNITSQSATQTFTDNPGQEKNETEIQQSTEGNSIKTSTLKSMKIIRRPASRKNANLTPAVYVKKVKASDEISEDDNYPASFKALIQSKNASTSTHSPIKEKLTLKASQKVYKSIESSPQFTQTSGVEKFPRFRSKLRSNREEPQTQASITEVEANTTSIPVSTKPNEESTTAKSLKPKSYEYKPRGSYSLRNRKSSSFTPASTTAPTSQSTERPSFKYNRKLKFLTTESPGTENITISKKFETTKKSVRSNFPRRSLNITSTTTKKPTVSIKTMNLSRNNVRRPTYNPKSKYNKKNQTTTASTTEEIVTLSPEQFITVKKPEIPSDMPLIFSLLHPDPDVKFDLKQSDQISNTEYQMTVNSMSSTESLGKDNELQTKAEESENLPVVSPSYKFHANYKDVYTINHLDSGEVSSLSTPPVQKQKSRKYEKPLQKSKNEYEDTVYITTSRPKGRNLRKYTEFSKTTEASTNGIKAEPEKPKSRFSSKYRSSYIDKPFYKPTVPTVTPSTAWLKFFVTDQLLKKTVEDPDWFHEEPAERTTEPMAPMIAAPSLYFYDNESSTYLVEVEETQLGSDNNVFVVAQTQSPIYSADLRLSEPSQVMNVEASQHSPSVTVSIFDALADILTSTPKNRLSSTTESQKITTKPDVRQTLNGVSSNGNVNNNVQGLMSPDTFTSTTVDLNTVTKSVQNTDQSTQYVTNRVLDGKDVTPAINKENDNSILVNTPPLSTFTLPTTPVPTTPISARRPFAIKVLYSEPVLPIDKSTTVPLSSSYQLSTDQPSTVYNRVSDIIISNNEVVSSELTSMLSHHIKNIINNMDEKSRSMLSVDNMTKILKSLIPRALSRQMTTSDDVDSIPTTSPSLKDIQDTQIINLDSIADSLTNNENILQNVATETNEFSSLSESDAVNTASMTQKTISSTSPVPLSQMMQDILDSTRSTESNIFTISTTTSNIAASLDQGTQPRNVNSDVNNFSKSSSTGNLDPLPFFTNSQPNDFSSDMFESSNELIRRQNSLPLTTGSRAGIDINNIVVQDQLSPLQIMILSKKARVLQMIEDLIRQHNNELANLTPLTDALDQQDNIPLSDRLTKIINTMSSTTESNIMTSDELTTLTSTLPVTSPLSIPQSIQNYVLPITTTDLTSQTSTQATTTSSESISALFNTPTPTPTEITFEELEKAQNLSENTETTTQELNETNTLMDFELTTNSGQEETTVTEIEMTTEVVSETTTTSILANRTGSAVDQSNENIPTIPKKDYVIFGILPNNTVVRKNPNDDILESLTEASPYIIYGVLPNNTIIRKFPNGTRVPRIMQKIDILPISPASLRNPYSPIHNIPAIVRPQSNPVRISTNTATSDISNNREENNLTIDTVNNQENMITSSAPNLKDKSLLGVTTSTNKPSPEKSTASHVLSLRTTTMLPSVDEILLNSISSAVKEEMVISSMTSSTHEPRVLTLDIDPETKQIRTEKPNEGGGDAKFKFIPIDEVTSSPENTNVQKLATKKITITTQNAAVTETTTVTDNNEQIQQIPPRIGNNNDITTIAQNDFGTPIQSTTTELPTKPSVTNIPLTTTESTTLQPITATTQLPTTTTLPSTTSTTTTTPASTTTSAPIITTLITTTTPVLTTTTPAQTTTTSIPITTTTTPVTTTTTTPVPTTTTPAPTTTTPAPTTTTPVPTTTTQVSTTVPTTTTQAPTTTIQTTVNPPSTISSFTTTNLADLENRYQEDLRTIQGILNVDEKKTQTSYTTNKATSANMPITSQIPDIELLQALLSGQGLSTSSVSRGSAKFSTTTQSTTSRSIEEDIRQFEKDTQFLKALLQVTGQDPAKFNIPTLDNLQVPSTGPTTTTSTTTTTKPTTTTVRRTITTSTPSIEDDTKKLQDDAKLLQALLQAVGQNKDTLNTPIISGITSNVRIASNPRTTSIFSNPTTPVNGQPVYTTTRPYPIFTSMSPISTTLQPREPFNTMTTDDVGISTTFFPRGANRRKPPTTVTTPATARKAQPFFVTTEMPSTSTFSVEEDVAFLKNLQSVLSTNIDNEDPETSLANRIIALAVDRSLNEIEDKTTTSQPRTMPTTTTTTTTTTQPTTTLNTNTPSLEDDIKQFEQDKKLLEALLKATGQDPSKFNIPTFPNLDIVANTQTTPYSNKNINGNLKPVVKTTTSAPTTKPYGAKIAVKDDLKTVQDDAKLLQTLVKLQGAQETTTQKSKLTINGQSSDEALKKLIQKKPTGMISEATKSPMSLSTEYGKSNDALLAALLKEQGFGPTTASSLDEQLRLAALLNQVVVTPKARRITTPPTMIAPPPTQRRPILDGLAWLWQQWRETGPGPGGSRAPTRGPSVPSASTSTSNRVNNWFGSGPFVGNADDSAAVNRVPLDPPRAVTSEQTPGRGQLVSAAINVTRAFSQFLGAAIQGAAQTVQNVIRAGQRAATDVYTNGSG